MANRYCLVAGLLAILSLPGRSTAIVAAAETSKVVVYPAPAEEPLSREYEVSVQGHKVDIYSARVLDPPFAGTKWDYGGPYSFGNFDIDGPVTVRIRSTRSLRNTVIRPAHHVASLRHEDDHTTHLALNGPCKISVEPDGKRGPLLLFANPLEVNVPKQGEANVIYFGPGVHRPGKIALSSHQTLYLAGGAIVKGGVMAQGDDIRIAGRGILDGSDWEWRTGPTPNVVALQGNGIEVSGITIRGASHWTVVPRNSRKVLIDGVKICGSRVQNDDGINPCNSQEVRITNCFIRSDDDCVALKGLDFSSSNSNVERIIVEDSVLWCDRARIFLLGHESRAEFMREIVLRNLDIIHFTMTPFLFEPGEDMRLESVLVEDIRMHGEGQREFIRLKPVVNQYMRKKVPGFVRNIRFKDVHIEGTPGEYLIQFEGADAQHTVQDVALENVTITGQAVAEGQPRVRIGPHVAAVRISANTPAKSP